MWGHTDYKIVLTLNQPTSQIENNIIYNQLLNKNAMYIK